MAIEVPRPRTSVFPDFRMPTQSNPESFGGGQSADRVAAGVGNLGGTLEKYHAEKLESALQTAADEAMNKVKAEEARLTLEMRKARGKDAFQASQDALKNFDTFHGELEKSIGNEVVKRYVKQKAMGNRLALQQAGSQWSAVEGERWQDETDAATWETNRNAAIANPAKTADSIADTFRSLETFAKRKGMPPEWLAEQKAKQASAVHFGVLETFLGKGSDITAKDYFLANKDSFVGNDRIRAERMVQNESVLGEAQRQVDKIFSTYYDENPISKDVTAHYAPETEEAAMEEARKIQNPDVRAKAEELTRQRWLGQERSREAAKKRDMIDAASAIDSGKSFDELDPSLRDRLTATERKSLKNYAKGAVVTDDPTWYALKLMAANEGTRDDFKRLNLMKYIDKLSKADFQEIGNLQSGLIKDDAKAKKEADGFRGTAAIVNGTIGGDKPKVPKEDHEGFMRVVNEKVRLWKEENKTTNIPDKEVERITDELLEERRKENFIDRIPGWAYALAPEALPLMVFGGNKEPRYKSEVEFYSKYGRVPQDVLRKEVTADKAQSMLLEIPAADLEYIQGEFKKRGLNGSSMDILQAYSSLLKDRQKKATDAGK